jgi:ubiquinone/menaquinone biosynthesis C-methylase UbiE
MHEEEVSMDHVHFLEEQEVAIDDFAATGLILDVGGGGEGIIGRMKGQQVIAIDISRRELEEAPEGPLKVLMDARDLQFLDESFELATAFFSFMYIPAADHGQVLRELHRVLKPGGLLRFWEAHLPQRADREEEIVAFRLTVQIPGHRVQTGYGAHWPDRELDVAHYEDLARRVGFEVVQREQSGGTFYLELAKRGVPPAVTRVREG